MKEDNYLHAQVTEKIKKCENQYIETHTDFLDGRQQALVTSMNKFSQDIETLFYGGYDDAERRIFICVPLYSTLEECQPLTVIRVMKTPRSRELTHRDYLGSVLGLGIKREKIGDILVREDGADIIVLKDISEFLLLNYTKAGRTDLSISEVPIDQLIVPEVDKKILKDTVASLRIDTIVSSAFSLPRSKSVEAIKRGVVFVNNLEVTKVDFQISEGDKITLRGKGKVNLIEIGGRSKKDRIYVTFEKF